MNRKCAWSGTLRVLLLMAAAVLPGEAADSDWSNLRGLHAGQKIAHFHVAPEKHEALADETGRGVIAAKIFSMAPDAGLLIRRATAFGLGLCVHAVPHSSLLRRQQRQATHRQQCAAGERGELSRARFHAVAVSRQQDCVAADQ